MNEPEKYLTPEKMNEVRQRNRSLRRQFLMYQDAEIVYSLTHRKLLEMADEAGAIYRKTIYSVKRQLPTVLIP